MTRVFKNLIRATISSDPLVHRVLLKVSDLDCCLINSQLVNPVTSDDYKLGATLAVSEIAGQCVWNQQSPSISIFNSEHFVNVLEHDEPFHKDLKFLLGSDTSQLYIYEEPPGPRRVQFQGETETIYTPYVVHIIHAYAPLYADGITGLDPRQHTRLNLYHSVVFRMSPLTTPEELITQPVYLPTLANLDEDGVFCRDDITEEDQQNWSSLDAFETGDVEPWSLAYAANYLVSSFWHGGFNTALIILDVAWQTRRDIIMPLIYKDYVYPEYGDTKRFKEDLSKVLDPSLYTQIIAAPNSAWYRELRQFYPDAVGYRYCIVSVNAPRSVLSSSSMDTKFYLVKLASTSATLSAGATTDCMEVIDESGSLFELLESNVDVLRGPVSLASTPNKPGSCRISVDSFSEFFYTNESHLNPVHDNSYTVYKKAFVLKGAGRPTSVWVRGRGGRYSH